MTSHMMIMQGNNMDSLAMLPDGSIDAVVTDPPCGLGFMGKAWEPILLARKPLIGTVADSVQQYGTGALNIAACRVGEEVIKINRFMDGAKVFGGGAGHPYQGHESVGRWPANLAHDGSPDLIGLLGEASRCFYSPKCSTEDREQGTEDLPDSTLNGVNAGGLEHDPKFAPLTRKNNHPTVKPTGLMRWLCRPITQPGGLILDPFMGSGSTGKAAILEGFSFIGMELDQNYCKIAEARIQWAYHDAQKRANPDQQNLFV